MPSGLVKDIASSPVRRPRLFGRRLSRPARDTHPNATGPRLKKEATHGGQCTAPPALSSFIATDPPDSGTAGRRQGVGQRLPQPIPARRVAQQRPPLSPLSANGKKMRGGDSLGFSLADARAGEGAGTKSEDRGSGVRR